MTGWLISLLGGLLVFLVLRDIFHTLLHPGGHGQLSRAVMRGMWRVARRTGRVGMGLAGPLTMLAVIGTWLTLMVLGWALVYLPHLPGSFSYAPGLDPTVRSPVADALYLALVVGATLGFGDLVPQPGWLRVVTPLQAFMGFALFTASVTWILQIYPALGRRRALAVRLRLLTDQQDVASALPASVLHGLAAELVAVRVDLEQYTETYYFHDGPSTSLARVLPATVALAEATAGAAEPGRAVAGRALLGALNDLADVLDAQYLGSDGGRDATIEAYRADHHQ